MLGDSFAFGSLLDDGETIDEQLARSSGGAFDAYNLGVPGYGATACGVIFARTMLPASHAVYLFYENDLRNDGLATERNTVVRGFLVPRQDHQGRTLSSEELDAKIDEMSATPKPVLRALRLQTLRDAFWRALATPRSSFAELELGDEGSLGYRRSNVAAVVDHTVQMRDLAQERDMAFAVLVVPALAEAVARRHYALVREYATALRDRDITVLDPLEQYSRSDFYLHDGHFNSEGASRAATTILAWLRH